MVFIDEVVIQKPRMMLPEHCHQLCTVELAVTGGNGKNNFIFLCNIHTSCEIITKKEKPRYQQYIPQ